MQVWGFQRFEGRMNISENKTGTTGFSCYGAEQERCHVNCEG
jgi:hypothetical protein